MTASVAVGRPKIEGLAQINLRLLQTQIDALDALAEGQRASRNDPALNRTDLIREAVAEYLAARAKPKRSR